MKRNILIRHLTNHNCQLAREGAKHSIYVNSAGIGTTVPRHPEIDDYTARAICKQLGIPVIGHN